MGPPRACDAVANIPAGTYHNVINASKTVYSLPNHPDGTVHKAEADKAEEAEHHS
jgi:hypothetical protein